jgi:hypothetical protein
VSPGLNTVPLMETRLASTAGREPGRAAARQQKQKVFINLDNVITVEWLGDRTFISFVNGGMETLQTAADDVIQPYQVSGHAPLI